MMNTKKITYGAMFITIAILLPQCFHLIGFYSAGQILLPMHIPVLLGGMILGPLYGFIIGVISPIISSLLTGMPDSSRVLFMVGELAGYGLTAGLMYQSLKMNNRRFGSIISLIVSLVVGRLGYLAMACFGTYILGIEMGGYLAVFHALVLGMPGIVVQLLFVPMLVHLLEKGGYFHEFRRIEKVSKR